MYFFFFEKQKQSQDALPTLGVWGWSGGSRHLGRFPCVLLGLPHRSARSAFLCVLLGSIAEPCIVRHDLLGSLPVVPQQLLADIDDLLGNHCDARNLFSWMVLDAHHLVFHIGRQAVVHRRRSGDLAIGINTVGKSRNHTEMIENEKYESKPIRFLFELEEYRIRMRSLLLLESLESFIPWWERALVLRKECASRNGAGSENAPSCSTKLRDLIRNNTGNHNNTHNRVTIVMVK